MTVAVLGAGGMIGGHLTRRLIDDGQQVRAVDVKPVGDWWQVHDESMYVPQWNVANVAQAQAAIDGCDEVYLLAADMGGIGFIEGNRWACMNSTAINLAVLNACVASDRDVRVFYSSSACAYPVDRQDHDQAPSLQEWTAWQGRPEVGYGEEKLYGEALCETLNAEDHGVTCRVARYHNVYGPHGTWQGGREKAPAAICRKVAEAVLSGRHEIEIWGDGTQVRSYLDVADCVDGTLAVMASDHESPLNVGSDHSVSVNELVSIVEGIAGVTLKRRYDLTAAQGVAGRNSDNTLCQVATGWVPKVSLEDGLARLYAWIYDQMA